MGTAEYLTRSTCSFHVHSVPSCWPLPFLFFFLLFNDSITLRDPLIDPSAVFSISNLPDARSSLILPFQCITCAEPFALPDANAERATLREKDMAYAGSILCTDLRYAFSTRRSLA